MRKFVVGCFLSCLFVSHGISAQSHDSIRNGPKEGIPFLKHAGEWYLSKRDTAAIPYFQKLVSLGKESGDNLLMAYAYYRMGVCRYQVNDITRSTELYFQGLAVIKKSSSFDEMKAKLCNGLGWNFSLLGEYETSLKYLQQAQTADHLDNPQLSGLIMNNKGVTYKNLMLYDSALMCFERSLAINRKLSDQRQVRFNLNNVSNVLIELSRFQEAGIFLREALALNKEAADTVEIVNNLMNLSLIDVRGNVYKKAYAQLTEALSMAKKNNALDQQRRIYFTLTDLAEKLQEYEQALGFQRAYYKLTDSLYRNEGIEHSLELEARYATLMKEHDLQEAREHVVEQRFYLSIIIGVLLITFIIIYFLVRMVKTNRKNEQVLMKLNAEIQHQAEELVRANKAITTANEELEALVKYRTEVIQNQSKRLRHFSFVNSHEIRGPLATLMGLLGLLYEETSPEKAKQIMGFLKITSIKLDKIIRSVSRELEKEDSLDQ